MRYEAEGFRRTLMTEDIPTQLHRAIAAERTAYAQMRAADPMGGRETTPYQIKKFKEAKAAHEAAKAEVAKLRGVIARSG
jgi:hypothetical protein